MGRSITVRPEVRIRRPRHEVADFMFDPQNDLRWTGGITASRPARPGRLVQGASVQRTARFLGRSFNYGFVVTADDADALLELEVDRPFPMLIRYELADAGDRATIAAIHATGAPGWFFGWASPLLRRQVQRSISADLERLRAALETRAAHAVRMAPAVGPLAQHLHGPPETASRRITRRR